MLINSKGLELSYCRQGRLPKVGIFANGNKLTVQQSVWPTSGIGVSTLGL